MKLAAGIISFDIYGLKYFDVNQPSGQYIAQLGIFMTTSPQSIEDLTGLKTKLESQSMAEPQLVPIELLSATGKLAKIINNEESEISLLMRDEEYEVRLVTPIFVTKIIVHLDKYESVRGMRLVGSDLLTGKAVKINTEVTDLLGNGVEFTVRNTLTSFTLHRGGFLTKKLKKIQVFGIQPCEFEKFEEGYSDLSEAKIEIIALAQEKIDYLVGENKKIAKTREESTARLNTLEQEITETTEQIATLEASVTELTNSNLALEKSVKQKQSEYATLSATASELEMRKLSVESELAQKKETLSNININISKAEEKLKTLVSNVNVFTEEFSGFVDQGTQQVRTYIGLALVPLLLLCVVVYNLFQGAVDLSLKFEKIPNIDLLTLFMTRLPFVTIAALIVGMSVKIFFFLINRIIAIHQQRLDLAKIAVIAKDVSDASANDLQLSQNEIYEAKTYLKMNLLKAYLSDQISSFSYVPAKTQADQSKNQMTTTEEVPIMAQTN